MTIDSGQSERGDALLDVAAQAGATALVLQLPENFAWFTNGGNSRVDHAATTGAASIVLTPSGTYVVADDIDGPRLRDEQVRDVPVVVHEWFTDARDTVLEITGDGRIASDTDLAGFDHVVVADDIRRLRCVLSPAAILRYRDLGREVSAQLDAAMRTLSPTDTEQEAGARVAASLHAHGYATPVLLCGGARRMTRYRHPVPTDEIIGDHAMVVVCAEREGLHVNVTRFRHFAPLEPPRRRDLDACRAILHELRSLSVAGRTLADLHHDCRRLYREAGLGEQWRDHHQGGLTGYRSREVIATPATDIEIQIGNAFAWNPSTAGAKAEETFVLTADGPLVIAGSDDST
jgi:Xaa-Pro aminopeptidase